MHSSIANMHLEKRVGERKVVDPFEPRVRGKLRVNVEEHRHVDLLPGPQLLLLKAKALDLVKVEACLLGRYIVGGHPCRPTYTRVNPLWKTHGGLAGRDSDCHTIIS
jgi:hypothetical protein